MPPEWLTPLGPYVSLLSCPWPFQRPPAPRAPLAAPAVHERRRLPGDRRHAHLIVDPEPAQQESDEFPHRSILRRHIPRYSHAGKEPLTLPKLTSIRIPVLRNLWMTTFAILPLIGATGIFPVRDSFHMIWVDAFPILAQMVNGKAIRNRILEPMKHEPLRSVS
jgi:hypothetical protein